MKETIKGFFTDENGVWSSKRLIGIASGFGIIVYAFIHPSEGANNSILILALGGLGLSTIDKIYKPK